MHESPARNVSEGRRPAGRHVQYDRPSVGSLWAIRSATRNQKPVPRMSPDARPEMPGTSHRSGERVWSAPVCSTTSARLRSRRLLQWRPRSSNDIVMPVQPETESTDDVDVADKPRRLTLAGALAQRERTSAFTGSRIQVDGLALEVVEIGPYTEEDGRMVTFRARAVGNVRLQAGEILTTPWGVCRIVN